MFRGARNQTECAFGQLKTRWKFLTKTVDLKFEFAPTVINACFLPHHYCENLACGKDQEKVQDHILRHR